jgi:Ca2+-binding EF-hand superfamily protein
MATINEKQLVTDERLKVAFQMFDKDSSGALSPEEIKEVLCFDS